MKMIISYGEFSPVIGEKVFLAEGSQVIGNVTIGEYSSIWYNCVLRGDIDAITIGKRTNIQDLSVLHVNHGQPLVIEDDVSVGHSCILHGCKIGRGCLIGMGSIILNDAVIGENCLVGAGSLVTEKKSFPPNSLILGSPAKAVRQLTKEEIDANRQITERYMRRGQEYSAGQGDGSLVPPITVPPII